MRTFFGGAWRLLLKLALWFTLSGFLYYGMEAAFRAYRGHEPPTRYTVLLGGFACLICLALCRLPFRGWRRWVLIPLLAGVALTAYEYLFGLYFRECRGMLLWNYNGCAFQYDGLICLQFSLCWVGAALFLLWLDARTERLLSDTRFAYRNLFGR